MKTKDFLLIASSVLVLVGMTIATRTPSIRVAGLAVAAMGFGCFGIMIYKTLRKKS